MQCLCSYPMAIHLYIGYYKIPVCSTDALNGFCYYFTSNKIFR